jgi:hypothetical protein
MARRTKDAPGRVTPKGGRVTPKGGPVNTRTTTGRYTAPIPDEYRTSPWWVPATMLAFFVVGIIGILLNYLSLLPSSPSNWYLIGGLAAIILGFVSATRWH